MDADEDAEEMYAEESTTAYYSVYPAVSVANWFIGKTLEYGKAMQEKINLTPMKLQGMIYLVQSWHLGMIGRPLVSEDFLAWPHGPVLLSLYRELAGVEPGRINSLLEEPLDFLIDMSEELPRDSEFILEAVWKTYRERNESALSFLFHNNGDPWNTIYQHYEDLGQDMPRSTVIPREDIQRYNEELIGNNKKSEEADGEED